MKEIILGDKENHAAEREDLISVKDFINDIYDNINHIHFDTELSVMRHRGHNADLLENQNWNFYFMIGEVVAFLAIVAF